MTAPNQAQMQRSPGFVFRKTKRGILRRDGQLILHCEAVPLPQLAEKYGTPVYVYSSEMILQHYNAFQRAFRDVPHTICYSVKANSNLSILRMLAKKGCGFDIVSGGELERVLIADRRPLSRVCNFDHFPRTVQPSHRPLAQPRHCFRNASVSFTC